MSVESGGSEKKQQLGKCVKINEKSVELKRVGSWTCLLCVDVDDADTSSACRSGVTKETQTTHFPKGKRDIFAPSDFFPCCFLVCVICFLLNLFFRVE